MVMRIGTRRTLMAGSQKLSPPIGVAVTAQTITTLTLSFTLPAGATGNLYQGTSSGGESGTPVQTGLTGSSVTATGLTAGTEYFFTMRSVLGSQTSAASNEASASTIPAAPTVTGQLGYVAVSGPPSTPVLNVQRAPYGTTNWVTPTGGTSVPLASFPFIDVDGLLGNFIYRLQEARLGGFSSASAEVSPWLMADQFADTNGTLLSAHTPDVPVGANAWVGVAGGGQYPLITGGLAELEFTSGTTLATYDSGQSDVIVSSWIYSPNGDPFGMIVRFSNASNYWMIQFDSVATGSITLYENNAGSLTAPATAVFVQTAATWYYLKIVANGTTIDAYVNGARLLHYTSASFNETATKHGLVVYGGTETAFIKYSDFTVAKVAAAIGYAILDIWPTYVVTYPATLALYPQVSSQYGGSQTFSILVDSQNNQNVFVQSPAGVFTYTPLFEDIGLVRTPTIAVTDGTHTTTRTIQVVVAPTIGAQAAGNPQIPYVVTGANYGVGNVFPADSEVVSGTAYLMNNASNNTGGPGGTGVLAGFSWTSTAAGAFLDFTQVGGNPSVPPGTGSDWDAPPQAIQGPEVTMGPATGGPLNGKFFRYYAAVPYPSGSVASIGIVYGSTRATTTTKYAGNPVLSNSVAGPFGLGQYANPLGYVYGSRIYLFIATNLNLIGLWTAEMSDPTVLTLRNENVLPAFAPRDWDTFTFNATSRAIVVFDPFLWINPNGCLEFYYDLFIPGQPGAWLVSASPVPDANWNYNFVKKTDSSIIAPSGASSGPTNWYQSGVGEGGWWRFENQRYFSVLGLTAAQIPNPNGGGSLGFFILTSTTTGHFLNVPTTTFADGATTYAFSPNGYTAVNMTAVPASNVIPAVGMPQGGTVTVSVYGSGGVTMVCQETNGTTVTFTLHGMTNSHTYTVLKNGVSIGTATASSGGVLTFTNSAWAASDTIQINP